jgi:hypothetical protein
MAAPVEMERQRRNDRRAEYRSQGRLVGSGRARHRWPSRIVFGGRAGVTQIETAGPAKARGLKILRLSEVQGPVSEWQQSSSTGMGGFRLQKVSLK